MSFPFKHITTSQCDVHIRYNRYVNKQWTGEVTITSGVSFLPAFGCYGAADQFTLIEDPEWPEIHK
jgi:hypothetical protein